MSKKPKGDKPVALSKKERKALEAREAELAAELAAREAADRKADKRDKKSAKKAVEASEKSNAKAAKKKAKGKTSVPEPVRDDTTAGAAIAYAKSVVAELGGGRRLDLVSGSEYVDNEPVIPIIDHTPDEIRVAAHKVLDDPNSSPGAREKATAALETADIKERVQAKAKARAAEKTDQDAQYKADVQARAERNEKPLTKAAFLKSIGADEVEHQQAHLKKSKKPTPPLAARELEEVTEADFPEAGSLDRVPAIEKHVAEVVETELGRIFETGTPAPERAFVNPSDAGPELEEGRNGYKIIQLGTDGKPDPRKVRQMTRVTTFVGNIDDETTLKKWDKCMVAEGLAIDMLASERDGSRGVPLVPQINDIAHRRDVKVAKAIKADRKGKLGIGEVGRLVKEAEKEAKDALDAIVEEAAALAGRNDKANFGTHLHTLAEMSDEKGVDAVRQAHESGELVAHDNDGRNDGLEPMPVTATDVASIEAYAERMQRLGAKVIYSEAVIVNDEMGYAGRLDRIIMARLPELTLSDGTKRPADQRARRYVADIKSGRIDLGAGKIARQLAAYALGKVYDLETGERTTHGAARDVALVFHLPQGEGVCTVHAVDLKAGTALLKLSAEVRRARNTGRKTIDTTVDIADPATDESGE